uniref:Thioredoxin domain-containing protein n=1 Tax=Schlesneria paludicola TaxID=360056 RepID=A0A7C2JXQ2_9PLAN
MKNHTLLPLCLLGTCLAFGNIASAQQPGGLSPLQTTLNESTEAGKFTFIVFHRDSGESTRSLHQQAQAGTAPHGERAIVTTARVDDPAERSLVEKFGISRAPMPMAVVVAPNGAVTGLFPRTISEEQIAAAIVPPTMMRCMKELQAQKLVFVCLTRTDQVEVPQGVQAVQQFPQFKDRIALVGMRLDDPAEARFYQQMKLDPRQIKGPHAVLIAPPGVLVGQFDSQAAAEQIAAAIHQAGKCCEDANCKHNHAPQTTRPATSPR